jgi:hypothetical protein
VVASTEELIVKNSVPVSILRPGDVRVWKIDPDEVVLGFGKDFFGESGNAFLVTEPTVFEHTNEDGHRYDSVMWWIVDGGGEGCFFFEDAIVECSVSLFDAGVVSDT